MYHPQYLHKTSHLWLLALSIVLALILLDTLPAGAKSITVSASVPISRTDWNADLNLARFDPTLGILQTIEVTITASLYGEGLYENVTPQTNTVTLQHKAAVAFDLVGKELWGTLQPVATASVVAPPYDGSGGFDSFPFTFTAPSGGFVTMFDIVTTTVIYTKPADVAFFVGTGDAVVEVSARGSSGSVDSTGNVDFLLQASAAAGGVYITYVFEEPKIELRKLTNGFDANDPFGADVPMIAPNEAVTWTYIITNVSPVSIPSSSLTLTDSHLGLISELWTESDIGDDLLLSPGESWTFIAKGTAENLENPSDAISMVDGCDITYTPGSSTRNAYRNIAVARVIKSEVSDVSHYCNPPKAAIDLQKTIYEGHNGGASCPGLEEVSTTVNAKVTYCFVVTNTGQTYLDEIVITDTTLNLSTGDLTLSRGATPIAPGESMTFYFETLALRDLVNIADTEGTPTDKNKKPIPELPHPQDRDPARLIITIPRALDESEEPGPGSRVYLPLVNR